MSNVLFRKATAVWLVDNTSLTFDQIADFCSLSTMEVRTIADGVYEIARPMNPIENGQLTQAEIEKCQKNPNLRLSLNENNDIHIPSKKKNTPQNTYLSAATWLLRNYSKLPDDAIASITHTSTDIVETLRQRGKKTLSQVVAKSPVSLDICTKEELENMLLKFQIPLKKSSNAD